MGHPVYLFVEFEPSHKCHVVSFLRNSILAIRSHHNCFFKKLSGGKWWKVRRGRQETEGAEARSLYFRTSSSSSLPPNGKDVSRMATPASTRARCPSPLASPMHCQGLCWSPIKTMMSHYPTSYKISSSQSICWLHCKHQEFIP